MLSTTTMSKNFTKNFEKASSPDRENELQYETLKEAQDGHIYEEVSREQVLLDFEGRLRSLEESQRQMREEFRSSHKELMKEIKTLQITLGQVKEVSQTSEKLQEKFLEMKQQFLGGFDLLGKQILDIRRDFNDSSSQATRKVSTSSAVPFNRRSLHVFEWEVPNVSYLAKTQRDSSSQSYFIGELNFKILAAVKCTKDGSLRLRMFGQYTHVPDVSRGGRFDCQINVVDKTNELPDWPVFKVEGDFNREKDWMVGVLHTHDLTVKGYLIKDANVRLRFDITVYLDK